MSLERCIHSWKHDHNQDNKYIHHFYKFPSSFLFLYCGMNTLGFPGGSVVKNLPTMYEMQETWVWSLGGEDPLEEGMATHSSIVAWRIPWTEEPGGYSPWDRKESDTTEQLRFPFHFLLLGDHTRCRATQPVPQLLSQCSKAWELQLPKPRLPRALLRNERSLHPTTGNSPCSLKL